MIATLLARSFRPDLGGSAHLFQLDQPVRVGPLDVSYALLVRFLDAGGDLSLTIYPCDAVGNTLGSRIAAYEALQGLGATKGLGLESLQTDQSQATSPIESAGQVGMLRSLNIEGRGYITQTQAGNIEVLTSLSNAQGLNLEALGGSVGVATLSLETLQGIAEALGIPYEFFSPSTLFRIVEATVRFQLVWSEAARFSQIHTTNGRFTLIETATGQFALIDLETGRFRLVDEIPLEV